ncbi:hypothetical protein O6H91_02G079900 [Diphasiastrum complanatum]|uniref:Uncharacterized protein n=1 Tax=Diphasiastrum complanatum TaxID=34168 RepID=A0ACC2EHC2_DIPCM|nr:hypothetical protein O6H91_02G079900 [Diphasiastrum complanatum]
MTLRAVAKEVGETQLAEAVQMQTGSSFQLEMQKILAKDRRDQGLDLSLGELQNRLDEFAKARNWEQFHSPRNLLLALVGEVGEVSEIFQWRGEVARGLPDWNATEKEHLGEELSDVLLYLVRLADICDINLGQAALRKLIKNGLKYPVSPNFSTTAKDRSKPRCSNIFRFTRGLSNQDLLLAYPVYYGSAQHKTSTRDRLTVISAASCCKATFTSFTCGTIGASYVPGASSAPAAPGANGASAAPGATVTRIQPAPSSYG